MRTAAIDESTAEREGLEGHVVLAGYGVAGHLLSHALDEAGIPLVVLEVNAERVRHAHGSF